MKVSLKVLFSYNPTNFGSKVISFFTSPFLKGYDGYRTPSHVSILINDKWVFEATAQKGVIITHIDQWKRSNQVAHSHFLGFMSYDRIKSIARNLNGLRYDWFGLVYFSFFVVLHFLFKTPIPATNLFECRRCFFCTELLGELVQKNFSMKSPAQIMVDCLRDKDYLKLTQVYQNE